MATKMAVGETDDPYFVEFLNSLVDGLVKKGSPQGLWIIQIDNWFDHKWLRFSGIGVVDFQFPAFLNRNDGALDEFYQDKVTFPPFAPNRIMGQWSFHRVGDHYEENALPVPHPSQKQAIVASLGSASLTGFTILAMALLQKRKLCPKNLCHERGSPHTEF